MPMPDRPPLSPRDVWGAPLEAALDWVEEAIGEGGGGATDPVVADLVTEGALTSAAVDSRLPLLKAENYGVLPSNPDNKAALEALWAAIPATGAEVYLAPGVYDIATKVTLSSKPVVLRARGAVIRKATSSVAEAIVTIGGARFLGITTLAAAAARGATSITLASTSGINAGDYIVIRSTETFNPDRPTQYTKGEIVRVLSSPGGGSLTLDSALVDSYAIAGHAVTIDRIRPIANSVIDGLTVQGGGAGQAQTGLQLQFFENLRVTGVRALDCERVNISVTTGRNVTIDSTFTRGANESGLGYGIVIADTDGYTIRDSMGVRNRHSFDIGQSFIPSRRGLLHGLRASMDTSAGISSHGNADGLVISACETHWCGGGVVARGKNTTIENCYVNGIRYTDQRYFAAYYIGDFGDSHPWGVGQAGVGLRLINNRADLTGSPENVYGVFVTASTDSAAIEGNVIKGATRTPIYLVGDNHKDLRIVRNDLDATGLTESGYGIHVEPRATKATATSGIEIGHNSIRGGASMLSGVRVAGGPTATPLVDVDPHDNRITGATGPDYSLAGAFALTTGDIAATYDAATYVVDNVWGGVNHVRYVRVLSRGVVSAVRFRVVTSSGNVCVGVYRGTGAGRSRVPGARIATSGTVPCPSAGDASVTLDQPAYVMEGDFLAMSCDNTTASFRGGAGGDTALLAGMAYRETAFPLPATAGGSLVATNFRLPHLVGA